MREAAVKIMEIAFEVVPRLIVVLGVVWIIMEINKDMNNQKASASQQQVGLSPKENTIQEHAVKSAVTTEGITSYGNGVFYFSFVNDSFGNSLSAFIKEHPELELTTIAPNDSLSRGYPAGHFVVFKPKPISTN